MNKKIFLVIIIFLSLIISCKKEIFKTEYYGTLRHYYSLQPLSGVYVRLRHGHGSGWLSSTTEYENPIQTDNNGKFSYKLRAVRDDSYYIDVIDMGESNRYHVGGQTDRISNDYHPMLLLKPSGAISLGVNDSIWATIPDDTIIVKSIYSIDTIIKHKNYWVEFYVEPLQQNKFIWYCLRNGAIVNYNEKLIYVPNAYKPAGGFESYASFGYSLTF